jgi:hypothetical protein
MFIPVWSNFFFSRASFCIFQTLLHRQYPRRLRTSSFSSRRHSKEQVVFYDSHAERDPRYLGYRQAANGSPFVSLCSRCSIGSLTPFRVNVNVASIASYLPSSTAHDNAIFTGTTNDAPPLTPIQEAEVRAQQIADQQRDAEKRPILYDADADADADDDPDYERQSNGSFIEVVSPSEKKMVPVGMRNQDGEIVEMKAVRMDVDDETEVQYRGFAERIPSNLQEVRNLFYSTTNLTLRSFCLRAPSTFQ